jgi:hypothetical protein
MIQHQPSGLTEGKKVITLKEKRISLLKKLIWFISEDPKTFWANRGKKGRKLSY